MLIKLQIFVLLLRISQQFSIPGFSLKSFQDGQQIPLQVNELDSQNQLFPYEYYYLNYCKPKDQDISLKNENLGSIILGESTQNSPYELFNNRNQTCKALCTQNNFEKDVKLFKWMIDNNYRINMVIDNLPALKNFTYNIQNDDDTITEQIIPEVGFPIGYANFGDYFVYNHLKIILYTHQYAQKDGSSNSRVVEFYVEPSSKKFITNENSTDLNPGCQNDDTEFQETQQLSIGPIVYSYDIEFRNSYKSLGSRWDLYEKLGNEQIHWISIINSISIVIFLAIIIAHIMNKTLSRDIKRYQEIATNEDIIDHTGWFQIHLLFRKQLSRDVFRPPKWPLVLACTSGAGIQIISMLINTLFFITLGFLNQAYRGSLLTMILIIYVLMGSAAGFCTSRLYKMFKGINWFRSLAITALFYPLLCFGIFIFINICLEEEQSSAAIPLGTVLTLFFMWFGVSIPLVFLGGFIGFRKNTIQNPCKAHPIPKIIPQQPWFLDSFTCCILGGLIPFGSVFIELTFIMTSIWRHSFYYLFAFLFVVMIILFISCIEVGIVITYLQILNGNHKWWWRSFLGPACTGIYVFIFSIYYQQAYLSLNCFSSYAMYYGYMFIISFSFFIVCGTIGFLASFYFMRKIYSLIKLD